MAEPGTDAAERRVEDAKAEPVPIETLQALFTVKGASPRKLFRTLSDADSRMFSEEDARMTAALLPERDPYLARTRQLLHEAMASQGGRFEPAARAFALRAIEPEIRNLQRWPPAREGDPVDALRELATSLRGSLAKTDKRRRAGNVLMIGVDVLSSQRGLSVEAAAPVLRSATTKPSTRNPARHRLATLTQPRNDLSRLGDLLDVLVPWERAVQEAKRAQQQAEVAAQEAEDEAERLRRLGTQRSDELDRTRTELEAIRQEAADLRDRVRDQRIGARNDINELRGRVIRFLDSRLQHLLATAQEAGEVDPPRVDTVVRLVAQATAELRKEIEWLRSSA